MHQPAVFGLCLEKFGGRHAEAEDACSRVMQKAHQVLPEMAADIRNVGGWLARMTVIFALMSSGRIGVVFRDCVRWNWRR